MSTLRVAVRPLAVLRILAATAVVAGAAVAATSLFAGMRDLPLLLGAVLVGASAPTAIAAVLPGRDRVVRLFAGAGGLAAYVVLALAPGGDVVDGPRRLLTGALPLDPSGPELATVALVVGGAAVAAAELALRPSRTPVAAVPGLAAYAVVLWVSASGPAAPTAALWLVIGGVVSLLAVLAPHPTPSSPTSHTSGPRLAGARSVSSRALPTVPALVAATLVVAAVTTAAVVAASSLPGTQVRTRPADARDLVTQPVQVRQETSPLVRYPALREGADRPLFVLKTPEPPGGGAVRIRWVVLDRFDGSTWTTTAAYQRAGRTLPSGPSLSVPTDRVSAEVEVRDPEGTTWLPTLGRATRVSVSGLGVDPESGELAVPADDPAPSTYQVTGLVPRLRPADLRGALTATPPSRGTGYEVPPPLQQAAQAAGGGSDTAFGRLAALESSFRRSGRFAVSDPAGAPGGHGLFQISRLLADREGTAEQYASAFAVMARELGYDARVVVGFRTGYDKAAGAYVVGSRAVHAWPEVRFVGLDWVAFEPTPSRRAGAPEAEEPDESAGDSAVDQAVEEEESSRAGPAPTPAAPAPTEDGSSPPWALAALGAGVLAGLAVLGAVLVPVAKSVRRRRRRARPTERGQVLAAWSEAAERLGEHGVPAPRSLSRPEVAASASRQAPELASPLGRLARLADDAGFAPVGSPAGSPDAAWQHVAEVRRVLRSRTRLPARVRAALDPRPLARR